MCRKSETYETQSGSENLASLQSISTELERSYIFRSNAIQEENPYKGGLDWKKCRKSDVLIVAMKLGNAGRAKENG